MENNTDIKHLETLLEAAKLVRVAFRDGGSHIERIYALGELDKQIQKHERKDGK